MSEVQKEVTETSEDRRADARERAAADVQREQYRKTLRSTFSIVIIVIAALCLIAALLVPVFRIYGSDMEPSLHKGNMAAAVKKSHYESGDVVVFQYNNKTLIRRVIAEGGDWVEIDSAGNVTVNNELLQEPYLNGTSRGSCDLEMPYEVPEGCLFVLADRRSETVDSRQQAFGCIDAESVQGKLILRIWPIAEIGRVK